MSRQSDFLRDGRVLRLATNEEAGPHVAPVWYLYDSGLFYIGTNSKTRKVRNIERDGRVGFSIDVASTHLTYTGWRAREGPPYSVTPG